MINKFNVTNMLNNINDATSDILESGIYKTPLPGKIKIALLNNNSNNATIGLYLENAPYNFNYTKKQSKIVKKKVDVDLTKYDETLKNKLPISKHVWKDIISLASLNKGHFQKMIGKTEGFNSEKQLANYVRCYADAIYNPTIKYSYTVDAVVRLGFDPKTNDGDLATLNDCEISPIENYDKFTKVFRTYIFFYLILRYVNEPHIINSMDPDLMKSTDASDLKFKYSNRIHARNTEGDNRRTLTVRTIMNQIITDIFTTDNPYPDNYLYDDWESFSEVRNGFDMSFRWGSLYNKQGGNFEYKRAKIDGYITDRRIPGFFKIGHRYGIIQNRFVPRTEIGSGASLWCNYTKANYEVEIRKNGDEDSITVRTDRDMKNKVNSFKSPYLNPEESDGIFVNHDYISIDKPALFDILRTNSPLAEVMGNYDYDIIEDVIKLQETSNDRYVERRHDRNPSVLDAYRLLPIGHRDIPSLPNPGLPSHLHTVYHDTDYRMNTYLGLDTTPPKSAPTAQDDFSRPYISPVSNKVLLKDNHIILTYGFNDDREQDRWQKGKYADESIEDDSDEKNEYVNEQLNNGLGDILFTYQRTTPNNVLGYTERLLWKHYRRFHLFNKYISSNVDIFLPEKTTLRDDIPAENNKFFYANDVSNVSDFKYENIDFDKVNVSNYDKNRFGQLDPYATIDLDKGTIAKSRTDSVFFSANKPVTHDWGKSVMAYHTMLMLVIPYLPGVGKIKDIELLGRYYQKYKMDNWLSPIARNEYKKEVAKLEEVNSSSKEYYTLSIKENNQLFSQLLSNVDIFERELNGFNITSFDVVEKTGDVNKSSILIRTINKAKPTIFDRTILKYINDNGNPNINNNINTKDYNDIISKINKNIFEVDLNKYNIYTKIYKTENNNKGIIIHQYEDNIIMYDRLDKSKINYIYTDNNIATENKRGLINRNILDLLTEEVTKTDASELLRNYGLKIDDINGTMSKFDYSKALLDRNDIVFRDKVVVDTLKDNIDSPIIKYHSDNIVSYDNDTTVIGDGKKQILLESDEIYSVLHIDNPSYPINGVGNISASAIKPLHNDRMKSNESNKWKLLELQKVDDSAYNTLKHDICEAPSKSIYFKADSNTVEPGSSTYYFNYVCVNDNNEMKKLSQTVKDTLNNSGSKLLVRSYVVDGIHDVFVKANEMKVDIYTNGKIVETVTFARKDIAKGRIAYYNINNSYGDINVLAFGVEKYKTNNTNFKYSFIKNKNLTINGISYIYDFKIYWR